MVLHCTHRVRWLGDMTGPGDAFPWMAAWEEAQREFARFAASTAPPRPSVTAEAQRRLADYAADYAGIAAAFWNQMQSPHPDFDALREPLIERYRQLFMTSAVPAGAAGDAGAAWIRYQQATERCAQQATAIAIDASERLRVALADDGPEAQPITSLRELHALWVECGEAAYSRSGPSRGIRSRAGGTSRGTRRIARRRAATMTRLAIDPARAAAEMVEFSRRMALAAGQLAGIEVSTEGCSPRAEVHRQDKTVLWRYERTAESAGLPPLVICYALVNRPYMMDLQPDRSLIRGLLARGLDVYLVDWGYPDADDRRSVAR